MTDLTKLHETFFDWLNGLIRPRSGLTTLKIYEICAAIQLKTKDYIICIIKNRRDLEYIFPLVTKVFEDEKISILGYSQDSGIINAYFENRKYKILFFTETNEHNVGFYDGFVVEFD